MNISFLISNLGGGGAENVCVILANALSRISWHVEIIVLSDTKSYNRELINSSIKIVSLNSSRARYSPFTLSRYLQTKSPDILVTMNNEVLVAEYFANIFIPRRYVLVHRCVTTLSATIYHTGYRRFSFFRYWLLKNILGGVECVVNQCNSMAEDTLHELKKNPNISRTIYNPVRLDKTILNEVQSQEKAYILLVGRLDSNKSFHFAIEGIAALPVEHNDVELWIAGTGPCKQELLEHSQKYGINHRVKLLGFCNDLKPLYQNAALVSLTSKFEGFPNVLLESIANGTPIVSVDCPNGPNEIVIDGIYGFLVKNRNAKELSIAYTKALKWNWSRNEIRQTAKRFSEEHIVKQWDELLKNLSKFHDPMYA